MTSHLYLEKAKLQLDPTKTSVDSDHHAALHDYLSQKFQYHLPWEDGSPPPSLQTIDSFNPREPLEKKAFRNIGLRNAASKGGRGRKMPAQQVLSFDDQESEHDVLLLPP